MRIRILILAGIAAIIGLRIGAHFLEWDDAVTIPMSIAGVFVLLGICVVFSTHIKSISWRLVIWGISLQIIFALAMLKTTIGYTIFQAFSDAINKLISFTDKGASFVFGWMYKNEAEGFSFVLDALMTIIFFSALMSFLYHIGVMQWIVSGIAKVMQKSMKTSGSETLSSSANIFVGQTEAPLVVKPFIDKMTKSEIMAVMTGGFATVAGGVMAAYVGFGVDPGHLLVASVMSAPAALVCAKIFLPETEQSVTAGQLKIKLEKTSTNVFDSICTGAADGMKLVLNVAAMLLAFICIIAMIDWGIMEGHRFLHDQIFSMRPLIPDTDLISFSKIVGLLFWPIALILGVPWQDCLDVGQLLGVKMVVNEFVAYLNLRGMEDLSPRAYIIATYAFCGFANFSSIAIQIGGISTIAPGRRKDLAQLGFKAMLAGTIAAFMTANIAGALLTDEQMERDYRKNKARVAKKIDVKVRHYDAFIEKYPDSSYGDEIKDLKAGVQAKALEAKGDIGGAIEIWEKRGGDKAVKEILRLKGLKKKNE